jgi:hypothetical protein
LLLKTYIAALATSNRDSFANAQPFQHVLFDDFLPRRTLEKVLDELPPLQPTESNLTGKTNLAERYKTAATDPTFFGPYTTHLLYQLNAAPFLGFLENLTGVKRLIADTRFHGGGYHLTRRGGRLAVHTDFSHRPYSKMRRRLNLLVYLNKNWKEEYGGHLELWNKDLTECKHKILPIFNRCVIFATDTGSPHGQPEPLACPPERGRQSLAFYYFDSPFEVKKEIETNYMNRPQDERLAKRLLPPIIVDLVKHFRS